MTILPNKNVFEGKCKITYLLKDKDSDYLVVMFSAFSTVGKPPLFNYMKTIEHIVCKQIFILDDYGPRGSYYLGNNGAVEESIIQLIDNLLDERGMNRKQVIACGSSKGGYAALYFGIKYGFGHIISGSPQALLGNFLMSEMNCVNIAEYITGGNTESHKEKLNNVLEDVIFHAETYPDIHIHAGKGERGFRYHIQHLMKWLDQKNEDYNLDLGDYQDHSEVGVHFKPYLVDTINKIINKGE